MASGFDFGYENQMNALLTPEQQAWLEAQAAAGNIPSVEEAVRAAVADVMEITEDDLAWAKSYVDAARSSASSGSVTEGAAFIASLRERAARLRSE